MTELEHELNKIVKAIKSKSDLSTWKNNPKFASLVNLLSELSHFPKTQVPHFDLKRVREQILDRIAVPVTENSWLGKLSAFAPFLRLGAGVMATLFIVMSLTLGTAVAALDSVPGSAIYPLKKVVENIQLKLTPSDQKTNLQLKFANNRVNELERVLEQKEEGKISEQEASAIVADTVKDIQKTAAAAVSSSSAKSSNKSSSIANKLAVINKKLQAASVQSEGQVKIELEKAVEATKISQDEAIKNLENAGLKLENPPMTITDDSVKASGKLTAVATDSVSIGTAKFLLNSDTKYVNFTVKDLKAGVTVDITGKIKDNKAYAVQIKLITEIKTETTETVTPADPQ
jgi:hypothetical protein